MARPKTVTPKMIKTMHRMRERGRTMLEIAEHLGLDRSTISYHLNAELREKRREYVRERKQMLKEAEEGRAAAGYVPKYLLEKIENDWKRLRREIPRDTRTFTQRFFGDPLPGRSALDRKQMSEAAE